ncbi:GntR family transcriptional regulator [Bordetella genomosp. 9]|uniref:GntR family transcriptional regulator n=1 Tax=Bordetella genomosp. 9 TaxID=1416803 RepID=A0A1W6YXU5_9BORD|nr:GntR family transcriptional regulator [Bordetella genomosp. 9]ARP85801.1 GntR family transcriptional regulator [Bordetella genomosp. 9]
MYTDQEIPRATPLLAPVERAILHDSVTDHLRNFIIEGKLAPGMKLNERQLCETLGISRTPLREALKVLAAEGLIEISPNRGATVARMTEAEIREAFEVLSGLEAFSGELACERITDEEVAQIQALHDAMLECRARGDLPGYYSRNQQIHDRINLAARNDLLRQTYLSVNRRVQALRLRSNLKAPKWASAIADHEQMLDALRQRDGARLGRILRKHMLDKSDAILELGLPG